VLLTPLPLVVLANAAQTTWGRRAGLRLAGDVILVALPALVTVIGVAEGLAALASRASGPAVAAGFGLAAAGGLAGLAGSAQVVRRLARVMPLDPGNQVHRLAMLLTVGLVAIQVVTQLTSDVLAAAAAGPSLTRIDLVAQEIPFLLAALLGVGLWIRRSPAAAAKRLGAAWPRPWQVLLGVAVAGLFYAFGVGAETLAQWLTPGLAQRVNAASGRIFSGLGDPVGIATIAIAAGVCEEFFFRGALQPRLGLFWPALVFASVHTQYGLSLDALAVLVLALGLGLLRRYTNTTTSALCHVTYNTLVGVGIGGLGWAPAIGAEALLLVAAVASMPAVRQLLTSGVGNRRRVG
jgi:uncharacterized protein